MEIVKVPRINALGKKGAEKAGNLVLSELKKNYSRFSKLKLEEIHVDNSNVEESEGLIYKNSLKLFEKQDKVVFLGGDHSISSPICRAFGNYHGFDKSFLVVFDAHADCDYENKEATHEEWLRSVINAGFLGENIVLIGVRKMWDVEKRFLREKGVKVFDFSDLDAIFEYIKEKSAGLNVYVSIDIDVLDPNYAPGVYYPEEGGLTDKELIYLLRKLFGLEGLKAIDLVEIVPEIDEKYDFKTVKMGAKILQEFLEIV